MKTSAARLPACIAGSTSTQMPAAGAWSQGPRTAQPDRLRADRPRRACLARPHRTSAGCPGAICDQARLESDPEYWISEGCLPSQAQVLCEARQQAVLDTQAALDMLERVKEVLLEFEGPEP